MKRRQVYMIAVLLLFLLCLAACREVDTAGSVTDSGSSTDMSFLPDSALKPDLPPCEALQELLKSGEEAPTGETTVEIRKLKEAKVFSEEEAENLLGLIERSESKAISEIPESIVLIEIIVKSPKGIWRCGNDGDSPIFYGYQENGKSCFSLSFSEDDASEIRKEADRLMRESGLTPEE